MKRPWYNFIYVRSPIAKILLGGAALLLTLALFGFTFIIEEPRMEAQTNSWTGRSIEKGAEQPLLLYTASDGPWLRWLTTRLRRGHSGSRSAQQGHQPVGADYAHLGCQLWRPLAQ